MERKPRVLVLGATGQVGGAVVAYLRDREEVAVIAAARDVGKARDLGVPAVHLLGYGGERYVNGGVIRHYVGAARLSWVDCEDVAAVAAKCLSNPSRHIGNTYRLGYEARTYPEVAEIMTQALGQTFRYEPRPPLEFLRNVLAAGAEPAYMKCVFDSYTDFTNGLDDGADETFDNFVGLVGRNPTTFTEFIIRNERHFRY